MSFISFLLLNLYIYFQIQGLLNHTDETECLNLNYAWAGIWMYKYEQCMTILLQVFWFLYIEIYVCKPQCRRINSVWQYYSKYYGFSISKYTCKPQWSLGKHCVLVTFCMPTRPKWTGAALLGYECRMYARSNRRRGLNLPGISLLQFRNVSQVYWHSFREPHEIHKSSMPGGMPPASTSCKVRTTLRHCSQNATK
jgi:hypothetical protein